MKANAVSRKKKVVWAISTVFVQLLKIPNFLHSKIESVFSAKFQTSHLWTHSLQAVDLLNILNVKTSKNFSYQTKNLTSRNMQKTPLNSYASRSFLYFRGNERSEQEDNALKQQTCDVETAVKSPNFTIIIFIKNNSGF